MKATELIEVLEKVIERFGDGPVRLEVECNGARSEQALFDVLSGDNRFLLISKEAMDADPLMALPTMPNLSLVGTDSEPH